MYDNNQWREQGVWNTTQKQQLLERYKSHTIRKPTKAQLVSINDSQTELRRELQQLRQQLQHKESVIETLTTQNTRLQTQLEQLHDNNTELRGTLERKETAILQKDNQIQQSSLQIQTLQNNIAEREEVIVRNDTTIAEQQREISRYRDNPHWCIHEEEVEVTGEVLGRGGWGEVKVGVFRGTRVAVKTLYEVIVNDYYLQLFSREMEVASRVRHPNLLQFIGATKVSQLMIITELMPTSLRRELEKHSLLRSQVISIATDVVSALNYLHSFRPRPILHRDVSSANVLLEPSVSYQWKGKLSDYGSANLMDNINTSNPGSPVYSAPEASTPSLHSAAMDIYSFGILLTEMCTGQFPSSVSFEREAQIRSVKWRGLRDCIVRYTNSTPGSRPPTGTVLQQLTELSTDEYNR